METVIECRDRDLYLEALSVLKDKGVDVMLGGAFAVYHYTGWWRDTHDIDVYTTLDQLPRASEALAAIGFEDVGEQAEGDREWIYHSAKGSVIVDVIWRFANLIKFVEPGWFERAGRGQFLGMDVAFLPLEELIWIKSFVINRHRCDWMDVMRIIQAQCEEINWKTLLELLDENWLLMAAVIDVFDWQNPGCMHCVPDWVREEFARRRVEYRQHPVNIDREHLLDPWLHLRTDRHEIRRDEQSDVGYI